MYIITQLGSLGGLIIFSIYAWRAVNLRSARLVLTSGFLGWLLAKYFKVTLQRDRPQGFFEAINYYQQYSFAGYGFPSGHSTLVAAAATAVYFYAKKSHRKYLLWLAVLVGISRMYLGAHLPLDVVGGWSLGIAIGSLVNLVFGNNKPRISAHTVKRILSKNGINAKSVRSTATDARGSVPFDITTMDGKKYFGKVFGEEEHAADWLFKIYRFFRFKNLHGEDPFLKAKRNLEMESLAAVWAQRAGVRTPNITNLLRINKTKWILIQERLDATPLSEHIKLTDKILDDVWRQVKILHNTNIAHRDLRAANIMIDRQDRAWLVDFGFAEVSTTRRRKLIDIAELLTSMSIVAGVNKTIAAAIKNIDRRDLVDSSAYVQKAALSGATTSALKSSKSLLNEIRTSIQKQLRSREEELADLDRFSLRKILNVFVLAVFFYFVIPQFRQFDNFLYSLSGLNWEFVVLAIITSFGTYAVAATNYIALAKVPLSFITTLLVQIASSFMSKILPGGVGTTALIGRYLIRSKMSKAQASATIAVQNTLSAMSFMILLLFVLLLSGRDISSIFSLHISSKIVFAIIAMLIGATIVIGSSGFLRQKVIELFKKLAKSFQEISSSRKELAISTAGGFGITLLYVATLYFCILAFEVKLDILDAALVYAVAAISKTAVPTPGGLGAVEVSMGAALSGLGIEQGTAFAVIVLYRLTTFWLPVPFSYLAYRYITKKRFV